MFTVCIITQLFYIVFAAPGAYPPTPGKVLQCSTCAHWPSVDGQFLGPKSAEGLAPYHDTCKYNQTPDANLTRPCPHSNDICASVLFTSSSKKRITIRTCLGDTPLGTKDNCTYFTGSKDLSSSTNFFKHVFGVNESVTGIRFCNCNSSSCNPFHETLQNGIAASNETSETLNFIFNIYNLMFWFKPTTEKNNNFTTNSTRNETFVEITTEYNILNNTIYVHNPVPVNVTLIVAITATVVALIFAILLVAYLCKRYRKSKSRREAKAELKNFYNDACNNSQISDGQYQTSKEQVCARYNRKTFEIEASSFEIEEFKLLGSDDYVLTCNARIYKSGNTVKVLARVPKEKRLSNTNSIAVCRLVQEIKVLSFLGEHENVEKFIGSHTAHVKSGWVCVFFESCSFGCLYNYLRSLRTNAVENELTDELSMQLKKWVLQVSSGMKYLASKQIVHVNLCTKSVFLDSAKTAKISNFGYSRRTTVIDAFAQKMLQPVNWQWMAPECLQEWNFTEKSDVWAFGVTMWEMYSFCEQPFAELTWTSNFATQLERGLRLEKAKYATEHTNELMLECWYTNPDRRPNFKRIEKMLE